MTRLSVVVPTFNRDERLRATLTRTLGCTTASLGTVEILVVDDGSPVPVERTLESLNVPPSFSLRVLRQANGGPARARNTGFRASRGTIVLFMDDDILPSESLLEDHVAAHAELPGAVVFGRYPWARPDGAGALFRLLEGLGHDEYPDHDEFVRSRVLASGHLSVERSMFQGDDAVYRDDLRTPGAEEYDLAARLLERGIPVFLATRIVAIHDSPVSLDGFCQRQFKLGRGCAEAARRSTLASALPELAAIVDSVEPKGRRGLRYLVRRLLGQDVPRMLIVGLARAADQARPQADWLAPLYRLAIGLSFSAGVRDGLRTFRLPS